MSKVVLVGGGVVGLFSAWYLQKKGFQVTVIDRDDFTDGCSHFNAGLIVPSHVVPLASPGMLRKGIKNLFKSKSAVGFRLAPEKDLLRWYLKFTSVANARHVNQSINVLRDLSLLSKDLFTDLKVSGELDFPLWQNGLLMLYQAEKAGEDLREEAEIAKDAGLDVKELSQADVRKLEPNTQANLAGGFHYHCDNHLNPSVLMKALYASLEKKGVQFVKNCTVTAIQTSKKKATALETNKGNFEFDELVITAGMWSSQLLKKLKVKIDVQPGKGYSFMTNESGINYPALLADANVAVTPLGSGLTQFAGGMEIAYSGYKITPSRVQNIINGVNSVYYLKNEIYVEESEIWQGHRPCSFDGLPYIGRIPEFQNIHVGTGHSMMGVTLGPVTGLLLSESIAGEKTSLDLNPFRVGR
ncbi:NAD(P)/FAD-dependent oxidoreductase [Maribellus mangrovi]|uniref:NAD(P)/FAD-dependent oxidoreductase n=1 Tax=Maribellus mangrovi TaxID=3133146 RepID=UPI0030EE83BD